MKKVFAKRITAVLLAATMLSVCAPSFAADEPEAELHFAAYYDSAGKLIGARAVKGTLSADEVDTFVDIYEPENTAVAKVFEWTKELKPINDSGRAVDVSDDADVVILHTNDMHGALVGSSSVIGSDSVAALKKLDDAILADGGDATQGVALASQSKGEDVIKIMNAAGYDVMAVGNHEFDYGLDQFAKLRGMADFSVISANTYAGDKLLCADENNNGANVIIDKNGIKVGFFALTTRDTKTATKPENLLGVEFKDEVETAKAQTEALDEAGADVIIAITHMGIMKYNSYTSEELAEAMAGTELDAIIDAHSHTEINKNVDGITVAQTGTGGAKVGRMEIDVAEDGTVSINETMLSRAFFDNITPDAEVTEVINDTNAELSETLKKEIGKTKTTLWGGSIRNVIAEGRVGETNFGDLICDAMIEDAKNIVPEEYNNLPIVAIENGGGYRASVPNGTITLGHIINALPFSNTVRIKAITPKMLYSVLEEFVSSVNAQDAETGLLTAEYSGSFPQIGGMRLRYNPNNPKDEKIESISLIAGNEDLDRNDDTTKLILASNDYVLELDELKNIPMIAEGSGLTEAVIAYINSLTENGAEPLEIPVSMGRIAAVAHTPDNYTYTAHISLLNADSLSDGDTVAVYVDGEPYNKAGTFSGGLLDVELPDGPHAIKLSPEQEEVYVNNYSGNGIIDVYGDLKIGYPELEYNNAG